MNQLILGDNLEILRNLESNSIDLIYLDPPFFSNRNYEVIWGDAGEIRSFQDRWSGGIDHYVAWLKDRVLEMHRLLKPTGAIFLHCDWHANAYIRVYILDKVFGYENFKNEITWQRTNAHNDTRKKMPSLTDHIFYYGKSEKHSYNAIFAELSEEYKNGFYKNEDDRGIWMSGDLTGPKRNPKDPEFKGYHPANIGRSWAVPNKIITELVGAEKCKKLTTLEKLELLENHNYIVWSSKGTPRVKRYLNKSKGVVIGDNWTDIKPVQSQARERIGYPTQKPEALLERILLCASNEGDTVLDPFVGGGTTVAVADRLKRQWIGIDQSVQAIKVSEMRLQKQQDLFSKPFVVQLHKYDYDTLRYSNAFEFETWIIQQYGGVANTKQRSDLGLDGRTKDGLPIQVKRSDNVGRNVIDNFQSACKRFDSKRFDQQVQQRLPVGILIAFSFGKGAIQEVARLKNEENLLIELVRVDDIVPIAKKPKLTVKLNDLGLDSKGSHEIELVAQGESDVGIEFYAWDFSYQQPDGFKADVMIDKEGTQTETFKPGSHIIAVKVVDNEGLDSLEVIQLKINGEVHSS